MRTSRKLSVDQILEKAAKRSLSVPGVPLGAGAWGVPVFENGYENYEAAGTFETAAYRKSPDGYVTLRGLIKHPAAIGAASALILPAGFRPSKQKLCAGWGELAGVGPEMFRIDIQANGQVIVVGNGAQGITYLSLASISFYAD